VTGPGGPPSDASRPLLRMASVFLVLPPVADVRDVYAQAKKLNERKIPITKGEDRLLRQVTWCMLQVEQDQEEGQLYQALAQIASLILAIIEDEELEIPNQLTIPSRVNVEALALQLKADRDQLDLSIGAAIGLHDLTVQRSADLDAIEQRLARGDDDTLKTLRQARIHLRQGEELLSKLRDRAKQARNKARFDEACARTTQLLARLVAVPKAKDQGVIRGNIIRRELKRIEVDALAVERLTDSEQIRRTTELLAWTEADLGEALTEANKAELAAKIQDAAASNHGDDDDWLSDMQ
jgi:hypothetical protein